MLKRLALKYWPLAFLFVLTVAVLCMSRYAESRKGDHQDNAPASSPGCSACATDADKGSKITNKPKYPPSWVDTFAWPEGVTGWALFLTLFVIAWQSVETRDAAKAANAQIKAMKDKERARIAVDFPPGSLELDDGPEWTEAMNVVYAGTHLVITNLGGTNAFNLTARVSIIGLPDGSASGFHEDSLLNVPTVLKPNSEPITEDVITLLKGVDHISAVKNKSEVLYLVGTITYDDIFEDPHETQFKYLWDVSAVNIEGKSFDLAKWERTAEGNRAT